MLNRLNCEIRTNDACAASMGTDPRWNAFADWRAAQGLSARFASAQSRRLGL